MKTILKLIVIIGLGFFTLQSFNKLIEKPNISPINKSEIISSVKYGNRIHPIYKVEKIHEGIDLISKEGTPIISTADGTIESVKNSNKGYGNMIVIKHNDIYTTRYAHLKDINVKKGEQVKKGQTIGTVGNTGTSTRAHLHYEIIENGKKVDPFNFFSIK